MRPILRDAVLPVATALAWGLGGFMLGQRMADDDTPGPLTIYDEGTIETRGEGVDGGDEVAVFDCRRDGPELVCERREG